MGQYGRQRDCAGLIAVFPRIPIKNCRILALGAMLLFCSRWQAREINAPQGAGSLSGQVGQSGAADQRMVIGGISSRCNCESVVII
jgi:hypothetical protein